MNREAAKELKETMDNAVKSNGRNRDRLVKLTAEISGDRVLSQKMQAIFEHTNAGAKLFQDVSTYLASRIES